MPFASLLRTKMGFGSSAYQIYIGALLILATTFLVACSLPSSGETPTGLALQVRVPASTTQATGNELGSEMEALELVGVDFGLVMVDDRELSSGSAFRTRFSQDVGGLDAGSLVPETGSQYLTRTLSWQPGQNASVQLDDLNPDARYVVVLFAELEIEDPPGVFTVEERYGYTRVLTRAGQTTAALVNLNNTYEVLSGAILGWYGIALPVKGAPDLLTLPPSPTNNTTPTFTVGGPPGSLFVYSVAGATVLPEVEVPDTGATGEETIVLPALNDGLNTVTVFIRDAEGSDGPAATFDIVVDTIAPPAPSGVDSADLQGIVPNQYVTTTTPTFFWTGSGEAGATWEYTVDNGVTWVPVAATSVVIPALPIATNYEFLVREIDLAGNISGVPPLITFDVLDGSSSTITIDNPAVPTFSINNGGVTLDRSVPDVWNLEAAPGPGVTITAFDWLVNGASIGTTQLVTLNSTAPETNLGANTLTLFVLIDGMWYSDSFVFQVVEN